MNALNPYAKQYKANQVQTATPEEVLILLYDGAIRFLIKAKEGLETKNYEQLNNNIMACQKIIQEFINTLDMENGGAIAVNLKRLYEYFIKTLINANIKKEEAKIDEVMKHLKNLRETWQKAIVIANAEKRSTLVDSSKSRPSQDGYDSQTSFDSYDEDDDDEDEEEYEEDEE